MTPLHIILMLHYNGIAEPYALRHPEHANSPAVAEYRNELIEQGLLIEDANSLAHFTITRKGETWVNRLCKIAGWLS